MKVLLMAALLAALPSVACAEDAGLINQLYLKEHGDYSISCAQETVSSRFSGWKGVPVACEIRITKTIPKHPHLGSVVVTSDGVIFDIYRDRRDSSYFGYTIERRGRVLWELPASARKDHGTGNPITGADRAAFIAAMNEAARGGGALRLRFKVAYSGEEAPIDLEIPARKWTAALRDIRRLSKRLGLSTAPW